MHIVSTIYLLAAFQGLVIASVLLLKGRKSKRIKRFLISFVLLDVGFLLYEVLVYERFIESYPHLIGVHLPLLFLLPPTFYFYMRSACQEWQVNKSTILHLLPALLVFFIMLPYYLSPAELKLSSLLHHAHAANLYPHRHVLGLCLFASGVSYGIVALRIANRSSINKSTWLRSFAMIFVLLSLCFLAAMLLMKAHIIPHRVTIAVAVILSSLYIHFIAFAALMDPKILSTRPTAKMVGANIRKNEVLALLEEQQIYKRTDLNMATFSQLLSTNSNYLSHFINQEFGCNFSYFLNSFRIHEAQKMIESGQYEHLNFLGIASMVGFNSKSTFTRAFKRHTGQTPSEYKRMSDKKRGVS